MSGRVCVSSADFIRNIGHWQSEALRQPLSITHHGRERLVLAAPDAFAARETKPERSAALSALSALSALRADTASVLENLDDGFLSLDAGLNIDLTNTALETFAGRSREDLRGAALSACLPQPLASVLAERAQRVMRARTTEHFEIGASEGRFLAVRVFPFAQGIAALLRNVTEVHVMRTRLERNEALNAAVSAHPHAAIFQLDARARIEGVNGAFAGWTDFDANDVLGHRFLDLVAVQHRRPIAEVLEETLRRGRTQERRFTILGKRGQEISSVVTFAPVLTDFVAHGALAVLVRGEADEDRTCAA